MIELFKETFDTLQKGGILMIPLLLCSFVAFMFILERAFSLRRKNILPKNFIIRSEELLQNKKLDELKISCKTEPSTLSQIVLAGLKRIEQEREVIREAMEEEGKKQGTQIYRYLEVLGTIAGAAPLLGLLGTVTGMIRIFRSVAIEGVGNPAALAGGISEALITTASGLTIAIPTFFFYRYYLAKADLMMTDLETTANDLLDLAKK